MEVCKGTTRKAIGHAEWQDNKGSKIMLPVHHLAKGVYFAESSHRGYAEVKNIEGIMMTY